MVHPPQLWVIAEPNGSGKTTLTRRFFTHRLPVVNPDDIAKTLNPNNPGDLIVAVKAGKLATKERQNLLNQKQNFAFETTFSGKSEIRLMNQTKEQGYKVNLVFVCTESPEISKFRIKQRVLNGEHHVPSSDVVRRYSRSLNNMKQGLSLAGRDYLLDNTGRRRRLVLSIENQKLKMVSRRQPEWLKTADLGFDLNRSTGLQR